MWQTDWAPEPQDGAKPGERQSPMLVPEDVGTVYSLFWIEHCIECAVPDCYKMCPLYVERRDRKCARFKSGISPNWQYPGLFEYGAEIEFRRWGKLEANFGVGALTAGQARLLSRLDRFFLKIIRPISSALSGWSPKLRLNGFYAALRDYSLQTLRLRKDRFDELVVEVWNLQPEAVRLVIECWQKGPKFRTSILLEPGRSSYRIPVASMNIDLYGVFGMIRAYPENDAEAHLVFSWLDFVKCKTDPRVVASDQNAAAAAKTGANHVKCVIWDLDNTVWDGLLAEQDARKISLRAHVLRTMRTLDERGILQSIASKNDHASTWEVLEHLGVAELFLYPQINWEPKSANIRRIVKSLNIGMDSCVFVDDSAFERAEVAHQLLEIRVFSDSDVPQMLDLPEFDVPATAESKQRRAYYVSESQRKEKALEFGNSYEAFLRTCGMESVLFVPKEAEQVARCLELLQRSNQLNLSTHRYTEEEFAALRNHPETLCICTSCRDRFGDYGIVGFASLTISNEKIVLKDFVLSCRVAQKKVENAWFGWLAKAARNAGYQSLDAPYVKSSRNSVLLNTFLEVGFVQTELQESSSLLRLDCGATPPVSDIVLVAADSLELRSSSVSSVAS
jgi:FkbH-like protein